MKKKVSIILINYNGLKFNKACIESILQQTYTNFEIIFVDNASSDWSLEEVEKIFHKEISVKKIRIVKNKHNEWFANGNNIGHHRTAKDSKYICMLNNDTTVPKDRLAELMKGIESDEELGAVGSMILDKGYEEDIKDLYIKEKKVFTSNIFWETALNNVSKEETERKVFFTSFLSWCCLLYKKSIINKPFPKYYFAYAEDVFLSWFILKTWLKLGVCTNSIVYHYGSWSFWKSTTKLKLFHGNKNQIINFILFYNTRTKIKLLPLFLINQIWHLFINHPIKRFISKFNAWVWIINNYKDIRKTKKYLNMKNKIPDRLFIKKLSYKTADYIYWIKITPLQKKLIYCINICIRLYMKLL